MTWAQVAIGWVLLSLPVLAFMRSAHVEELPAPNAIPDSEFDRLAKYARHQQYLEQLRAKFTAMPATEGRAIALLELDLIESENSAALSAFVTEQTPA